MGRIETGGVPGDRQMDRLPDHINSPEFAEAAVAAFRDAIQQEPA